VKQIFLILIKSNLSVVFLYSPNPGACRFLSYGFLTLQSVVRFWVDFHMKCEVQVEVHLYYIQTMDCPNTFVERTTLSALSCLAFFWDRISLCDPGWPELMILSLGLPSSGMTGVHLHTSLPLYFANNQLGIFVWVYFWTQILFHWLVCLSLHYYPTVLFTVALQ
jgi:hypothetical protein